MPNVDTQLFMHKFAWRFAYLPKMDKLDRLNLAIFLLKQQQQCNLF